MYSRATKTNKQAYTTNAQTYKQLKDPNLPHMHVLGLRKEAPHWTQSLQNFIRTQVTSSNSIDQSRILSQIFSHPLDILVSMEFKWKHFLHFSQAAGGKLFGGCAAQDKLFPVLESYVSFSEKISLIRPSRFQLPRNNQRETAESSKKKIIKKGRFCYA